MDIIILAAGHGTRLRPLTDTLPKPLIDIAGLSLIEIHLFRLAAAGFNRVIINVHHLGELIREKLGDGQRYGLQILYSTETDEALETAGGIHNALSLIKSETFIAISADVLCDYPVEYFVAIDMSEILGHLVMVENPSHHPAGDFALNGSGFLKSGDQHSPQPAYTFSGLACFKRVMFEQLEPGKRALRPVLEAAIKEQQLMGELHTGLWSDIGTVERLHEARASEQIGQYIASIKQSIS